MLIVTTISTVQESRVLGFGSRMEGCRDRKEGLVITTREAESATSLPVTTKYSLKVEVVRRSQTGWS